jgi:hypothetical protein
VLRPNRVLLDLGLTFSRFEQQVKQEVGGARGERLVEDSLYGLSGFATYKIWGPIEAGLFSQFDVGRRSAGKSTRMCFGSDIAEQADRNCKAIVCV